MDCRPDRGMRPVTSVYPPATRAGRRVAEPAPTGRWDDAGRRQAVVGRPGDPRAVGHVVPAAVGVRPAEAPPGAIGAASSVRMAEAEARPLRRGHGNTEARAEAIATRPGDPSAGLRTPTSPGRAGIPDGPARPGECRPCRPVDGSEGRTAGPITARTIPEAPASSFRGPSGPCTPSGSGCCARPRRGPVRRSTRYHSSNRYRHPGPR